MEANFKRLVSKSVLNVCMRGFRDQPGWRELLGSRLQSVARQVRRPHQGRRLVLSVYIHNLYRPPPLFPHPVIILFGLQRVPSVTTFHPSYELRRFSGAESAHTHTPPSKCRSLQIHNQVITQTKLMVIRLATLPPPPSPCLHENQGKVCRYHPWKIPALAIAPNKEKAHCGEAKKQGRREKRRTKRRKKRREVEGKRRIAE